MKPIFANPEPIDYSYDSGGDVIYLAFADQKAARTVELVSGWPILLVDGFSNFGSDFPQKMMSARPLKNCPK
jgi:hypothetical protein